jgi:hypothetical protein
VFHEKRAPPVSAWPAAFRCIPPPIYTLLALLANGNHLDTDMDTGPNRPIALRRKLLMSLKSGTLAVVFPHPV